MRNLEKYIGIPFKDEGSNFDGCNCWGLVRLVLIQEAGIAVPAYGDISAADLLKAARQIGRDSSTAPWIRVDVPQAFDVCLMTAKEGAHRVIGHIGIMTSPTHVLHVWEATHAVQMPLTHSRIRAR